MDEDRQEYPVRRLHRGESAKAFCLSFEEYRPVANGGTLSSPSVAFSSGNAALIAAMTVTGATVLTAAFEQKDDNDNVEATVAIGEGVKFTVTPPAVGGLKGEVFVTVLVTVTLDSVTSIEGGKVKIVVD